MVLATKISLLVAVSLVVSLVQAEPIPILKERASKDPSLSNKATCKTPHCVTAAKEILDDMNPKADPCQDFSQFACGGFYEKRTIAADQSSFNYFRILYDKNNDVIREIVDPSLGKQPTSSKTDPNPAAAQANLQKLQDLYASCMDESTILSTGRKPLLDQISSILSAFPSNSTGNVGGGDKTVLAKTLAKLSSQGISGFVSLGVGPDPIDPLINSLSLSEGGLGLPAREYYQDAETIKLYESTIGQMFQVVFGEEDVATRNQTLTDADVKQEWKDVAKAVVGFETQLAKIGTELVDLYDPIKSNNPRTVDQISAVTPSIDWTAFISGVLPTGVTNTRPIIVSSPEYLARLENLLNTTTPQTLRNYITWRIISNCAPNLGTPYRQPLHTLSATLSGVSPDTVTPRWKHCVSVINNNLGDMAGHYYIQTAFPGASRASTVSIINSILDSYKKTFPTLTWLDKPTLSGAMEKLKAIVKLIESPEYINYGGFGVVAGHEVTHGFDNMGHHFDSIGRIHN
ncbi:hypothetical protein BGX30_004243, partial [Mortierella sp. GBA39]